MADPIEYLIQNILKPELDVTTVMIMAIGLILIILWMITDFIKNKKLQTVLFNIHQNLKTFMEKNRTKAV
jgi:hypothetical protein